MQRSPTRRTILRGTALVGAITMAGCASDQPENGAAGDSSPTETAADRDGTPTDDATTDSVQNPFVRLSPIEDSREI